MSSISGSDSESEEEEGGAARGARRGAAASARPDLAAKAVFADAGGSLFAVWRAALASPREEKDDAAWSGSRGGGGGGSAPLQRLRALRASAGLWLLVLARGGHFAALVVRMSACAPGGGVSGAAVVAHRTFHRYVVRAKQGGRQGAKDATGKSIKSAGSALRRANEVALQRDVRALLEVEWRAHVAAAELIWLAVSDTDRRIVVGGEGAPVAKDDTRLRRVPFGTRRPTLSEAKRVAAALAAVEQGISAAAEPAAGAAACAAAAASDADEDDGSSDSDAEGAAAPPPQQYVDAGADPRAGDTPLHAAARAGDAEAVAALLAGGADPGARNVRGRVAYSVASTRATRDAFRRARAAMEESWDWGAAGVTSALTPEMEAAQAAKRAAADAAERQHEKVCACRVRCGSASHRLLTPLRARRRSGGAPPRSARSSATQRRLRLCRRLRSARRATPKSWPPQPPVSRRRAAPARHAPAPPCVL